jgi:hypothetical protein
MKFATAAILSLALLPAGLALGSEPELTALSCADFRPSQEAIERFPDLVGACEGVVEMNGELYGRFAAVVRRISADSVRLYLPATQHTFTVKPKSDALVLVGGRKIRPQFLEQGQEIQIYLSAAEFASPDIEEVVLVSDSTTLIEHPVVGGTDVKPARVLSTVIRVETIVEAVNKETRELKLIDAEGNRLVVVADDLVANFDQIQPRDRIVTEYLESVAVVITPEGVEAPQDDAGQWNVAPAGDKPGVEGVGTRLMTAKVREIDEAERLLIVEDEDGVVTRLQVSEDAPLDMVKVGDGVRLQITKALAINVAPAEQS